MPQCVSCGKKAGGLSLRAFIATTGRCDECEAIAMSEKQAVLAALHSEFLAASCKADSWEQVWLRLIGAASQAGFSVEEAFAYVRQDLYVFIKQWIEANPESANNLPAAIEEVIAAFALPEYYHQDLPQMLVHHKTVCIFCLRCGAGILCRASAFDYACLGCGYRAVIARCPSCSDAIHISRESWNKSVQCPTCGASRGWNAWNRGRLSLGDVARALPSNLKPDLSRRVVFGIVLGGSGFSVGVGMRCLLEFSSEHISIYILSENQWKPIATMKYVDVNSLQFGGRGAITSGGGWVGGGFGLTGIITGAVLASALNQITTRSTIESVIYFQTVSGELILFNNQYPPDQLRIMLSPAVTSIEAAHRPTHLPPQSKISQLRELAELQAAGTITEDEFQELKAALLNSTTHS